MSASCLFDGEVVHVRHSPIRHRLAYRIFMGLFDLDELPALARRSRLFGYNSAGVISFQDRDHGDGSGKPLRPQVEQALANAGIEPLGGPIRIMCMPRLLGFVFNPLSVYFCHDQHGEIKAIVHEVNNTYGERQLYVLRTRTDTDGMLRQACPKTFRVSPFLSMDMDYRFTIMPPTEKTSVHIAVESKGTDVLSAWFAGSRKQFCSVTIIGLILHHPVMTLKVVAGIHWEALFLWGKLRFARARRSG